MKRQIYSTVLLVFALAFLGLAVTVPAQARQSHQVLGGILLRQYTTEAEVSFSTVDASRLVKLSPKVFRRGIIILDDSGRSLFIRGDARVTMSINHARQFRLTNAAITPAVERGIRMVRVTHLTVGVFSGDDWAHWYDSAPVCNGQMGIEWCAGQWVRE